MGPETCSVFVSQPGNIREGARLKFHVDRLKEFVQNVGEIAAACVEGPSLKSRNNADDMGQIRGTFLYVLADLGIETAKIPPASLKKFATGNGAANKDQMIRAARKTWPKVYFTTDDAADAAWLAAMCQALHEDVRVTPSQLAAIRGIRFANPKPRIRIKRKDNI